MEIDALIDGDLGVAFCVFFQRVESYDAACGRRGFGVGFRRQGGLLLFAPYPQPAERGSGFVEVPQRRSVVGG